MIIYPPVQVLNDWHNTSQPELKLEDLVFSCIFLPPPTTPPPSPPTDISFKFKINKIEQAVYK